MAIKRLSGYATALFVFVSFSFSSTRIVDSTYKLVLFEGSDWCVNCIRFDRNVLNDAFFIQFMEKEHITIERVDFPQRKKLDPEIQALNASMAEKYDFQGIFPTILLVKTETNDVMTLEYHDQGALEFIKQIRTNIAAK